MHSLSILLPNNRLLNPESQSFSVRQAVSNLLSSSLKHVHLVFHCIRPNRINGAVNQYIEIISAFSNGLHTFGRDSDVTSRAICILLKYFTVHYVIDSAILHNNKIKKEQKQDSIKRFLKRNLAHVGMHDYTG